MLKPKFACFYFVGTQDVRAFAQSAFQFSSHVYLLEPCVVVIEFGKSARLFSQTSFMQRASELLGASRTGVKIAIDDNHLFPYIKAKHNVDDVLLAPLSALDDVLAPENHAHKDLTELRKAVAKLTRLQIRTLKDFRNLPKDQLPSRFGELGILLQSRLDGKFLPAFARATPDSKIIAKDELPASYNGALAELISVVERLLKANIFPPLRKMGAKLEELRITFLLEANSLHPDERRDFVINFVKPQFRAEDTIANIWILIEASLAKNAIHFSTSILTIEVEATKWALEFDEQVDILDQEKLRQEKENSVLSRHQQRYGQESVSRIQLKADRRIEKSFERIHDLTKKPVKVQTRGLTPKRPVIRLPSPHLLHISADRSTISREGKSQKIIKWEALSEAMNGFWFENAAGVVENTHQRIYHTVHLSNGREFLIFQIPDGRYFLQMFSA